MKKYIFPLFLGGISLGLTEFVMMGILPQLSQSLKITIPEAGHLISIYALGVVVGSPLLVIFSNKFSPKSILIFLAAFIAISNSLSALSTNYHLMLLVRFLSGLPHGAFFGIGAIVAIKLSPKGKGSAAIAMMFAGLTVANLMMVPVGTSIAIHFSWHYVFFMVGLLGFCTVMSVVYFIPDIDKLETKGLKEDLKLFKKLDIWVSLAIVSFGCGGMFAWYSYIAPLMIHVTKISEIYIPYVMALTGFGMLMGVIVGGKISDRLDPIKSTIYLLIGLIGCLLMVYCFSQFKIISLMLTFLTGAFAFALASPIQMILINTFKGSEMLGSALAQSGFNIANALGAFLGGLPLAYHYSYKSPEVPAIGIAILGMLLVIFLGQLKKNHSLNSQELVESY